MISNFPSPILAVAVDAVKDVEGEDALCGLWALFTKCKESLKDGRRLENISWRLWYREMASAQCSPSSSPGSLSPSCSEKRSPSPITPVSEDGLVCQQVELPLPSVVQSIEVSTAHSWHAHNSVTPINTGGRRLSTASAPMEQRRSNTPVGVGKMILDILPCKVDVQVEKAARTPAVPHIAQPRPVMAALPTVQLPATLPQPHGAPFPRVVVVNPTPHPTPPATPLLPHSHTAAAQSSIHLLPPPLARSLVSATISPAQEGTVKGPSPSKPTSPTYSKQRAASSPLTSRLASHDAIPPDVSKSKPYNDDTLKASDRLFFLQDRSSLSPDRAVTKEPDALSETSEKDRDQEPSHTPSSGTSSQMKWEMTGHTSAAGGAGGTRRPRVQARKSKERHGPTRPTLQRLHSHGVRQASQKKVAVTDAKKTTFNIGSVSSNGSRSANSAKGPDQKVVGETATARQPSPTAKTAANSKQSNIKQTNAPAPVANANANSAGPSQQRRGIVISTSSEYETDTDDDSGWASEDSGEDRSKARKANAAEEARLREAAEEAQRQRDMFAKVPKRSYSNLNRTRSGLLSQLLNPDPNIFPPNHPYGASQSTQDMTRFGRQAAPTLHVSKSSAAMPLAAQITAQVPAAPTAAKGRHDGGYRPKGRPQGEELEDTESDDDNPDDTIQVSHSLAQQKLAALADSNRRRHSDRGLLTEQQQLHQQQMRETGRPHLPSVATAPIPMTHPYNLPAPAPPMTPRATRRQMLQTELSESLRRNLLWERQVSRINLTGRRAGVPGSGLRPLTAMNGEGPSAAPQPQAQQPVQAQAQAQQQASQQDQNGDDKEERQRRAMARNRSWADEYHYSGW